MNTTSDIKKLRTFDNRSADEKPSPFATLTGNDGSGKSAILKSLLLATLLLILPGTLSAQADQPANDSIPDYLRQAIELANDPEAMAAAKAKGEKPYRKIRQLAEREKYREALDIYEQNKGDILVHLGNTTANFEFGEQIIALYAQVLDEEAATAKAIEIRTMNDAMMETVIAMGGAIPAPYLLNKNLLGQSYYRQGDYAEAFSQMATILSVLRTQGDTTSADYAHVVSNLGFCAAKIVAGLYPQFEQASSAKKDSIAAIAANAESFLSNGSELYNNVGMRHSAENYNALIHILDIEATFFKRDSLMIPCIEQILEIHAANDWPLDERASLARTHLLILYLANGDDDRAARLHARMQSESDEPLPTLDELKARLSSPD